jgi:hypothetical protein
MSVCLSTRRSVLTVFASNYHVVSAVTTKAVDQYLRWVRGVESRLLQVVGVVDNQSVRCGRAVFAVDRSETALKDRSRTAVGGVAAVAGGTAGTSKIQRRARAVTVPVVTRRQATRPGFGSRRGQDVFLSVIASGSALGVKQTGREALSSI